MNILKIIDLDKYNPEERSENTRMKKASPSFRLKVLAAALNPKYEWHQCCQIVTLKRLNRIN